MLRSAVQLVDDAKAVPWVIINAPVKEIHVCSYEEASRTVCFYLISQVPDESEAASSYAPFL